MSSKYAFLIPKGTKFDFNQTLICGGVRWGFMYNKTAECNLLMCFETLWRVVQTFPPMHHARVLLGVAVGEFPLALTLLEDDVVVSGLFERPISGCHAFRAAIWSIWLFNRLIPGKQHVGAGDELGLHIASSCKTSPILDSMLYAKFPSTREYASKIKCPTSYEIQRETDVIYVLLVFCQQEQNSQQYNNTSILIHI